MRKTALLCLLVAVVQSYGQRLENIRAEVIGDGEKIVITYDLNGTAPGQKFRVSVYSSHNSFASPLSLIAGDAGIDKEVVGGTGKRIEWSAKTELREYSGDITFELRAAPVAAAVYSFVQPGAGSTLRKGKSAQVSWQGGAPGEQVRLELLRAGTMVIQIANTQNNQSYSWAIPKDLAKGSDYQVRLAANSGTAVSGTFGIKAKSKLMLIAVPSVVVGGVLAYLLSKPKPEDKDLPTPPDPE